MSVNFVPNAARERELLAHLGLGPGASDDEIEAAHDDIVTFLEAAPPALRDWARGRLSDADQTYAILRGGLVDPTPAPRPAAAPAAVARPATAQAPQPARAAGQRPAKAGNGLVDDEADLLEEQDGHPSSAGRKVQQVRRGNGQRTVYVRRQGLEPRGSLLSGPMRRVAMIGGLVVAIGAVAYGGYVLGAPSVPGITGSPAPAASGATIDAAAVSALMQKLSANPKDVATLQDLANLYYDAGDFATASTWLAKVLEVEPKNIPALLGSGAASYNLGDYAAAEVAWRKVLAIDEKNVEAHYDLGWMYLSQNDVEKVKIEWARVIALDPTSVAAKTAASHLQRLDPSFSPAPLPSGAAATPAPTGATSPAPASLPVPTAGPS